MKSRAAECRYLLSVMESVVAGLDDSHLALEPQPGIKTAGWLIGHLAVTGDFARRLCGRPPICPKEWRARFNPVTQPSLHRDDYPSMADLGSTFRVVYSDLSDIASQVDVATLAMETPYESARRPFPITADFVAYLMTSHLAYHIGQLVAWRAAAGLRWRRV